MANESMKMSAVGLAALRKREGAILQYYNDIAKNCTFGVGILVHKGICTAEELIRPVTSADVDEQLAARVKTAEVAVKKVVKTQQLTQDQFDSLVSFTFNTGASGAKATLVAANSGANTKVVEIMNKNVYVHPRNAQGRSLPAVKVQGLVNRRLEEVVPFQQTKQGSTP